MWWVGEVRGRRGMGWFFDGEVGKRALRDIVRLV